MRHRRHGGELGDRSGRGGGGLPGDDARHPGAALSRVRQPRRVGAGPPAARRPVARGLVPRPGRRLLRARRLGRASVQLAQPRAHRAAAAAEPRRARHPAAHGQGLRRRQAPHPRPQRAALRRRAGRPAGRRGARRPGGHAGGRRPPVPRRGVRGRVGGRGAGAAGRSRPPVAAGPGRRGAGRQRLGEPERRSPAAGDGTNPADVSENTWLVWPLEPAQMRKGVHVVGIDLLERDPRLRPPVVVGNVEIHVSYPRDTG